MKALIALTILALCAVGSLAQTETLACAEPKNPNVITLRLMRHGWSCAQCCRDISLKLRTTNKAFGVCVNALLKYKDPLLTSAGMSVLASRVNKLATCLPDNTWTLMASTMTRTIETALTTFPKWNVLVVPYMKECIVGGDWCGMGGINLDPMIEDKLSDNPEIQDARLGRAFTSRVQYFVEDDDAVAMPLEGHVRWTDTARTTHQSKFFRFLARYAQRHNKRKFFLVTHSTVMANLLFKTTDAIHFAQNGEVWEVQLSLNGVVDKSTIKPVYVPSGGTTDCSKMTPDQFTAATARCDWQK